MAHAFFKSKKVEKKEPTPTKVRKAEETGEWETGRAPWAYDDCGHCEGSGWGTKAGSVCRICATKANRGGSNRPNPALFDIQTTNGGVPQYRYKAKGAVNGSLPPMDDEQKEEAPEKEQKVGLKRPVKKEKKEKPKVEKAEAPQDVEQHDVILVVGGYPIVADREVVRLSDFLCTGKLGAKIAKELDAECFLGANPFNRRDLVKHYAPNICKATSGKILVIDAGSTDERECASAFFPYASLVIRS